MFGSMFKVKVERVNVHDLSVTLTLKDSSGSTVDIFFDDLIAVRDFSRDIRQLALTEADKQWTEFDRPNLITDKKGSK